MACDGADGGFLCWRYLAFSASSRTGMCGLWGTLLGVGPKGNHPVFGGIPHNDYP